MLGLSKDSYEKVLEFLDEAPSVATDFRLNTLYTFEKVFGYQLSNFWLFSDANHLTNPVTLNISQKAIKEYLSHFFQNDILNPQIIQPTHSKQNVLSVLDVVSTQVYEKSYFYNDFMLKHGYYHEIAVYLKDDDNLLGILAFIRGKGEPPFDTQDIMCLEILARHLTEKLKEYLHFYGNPFSLLTLREQEILTLVEQGCTNAEIAKHFYISVNTVKKHVQSLYRKLNVNNRTSLIYKINHFPTKV